MKKFFVVGYEINSAEFVFLSLWDTWETVEAEAGRLNEAGYCDYWCSTRYTYIEE